MSTLAMYLPRYKMNHRVDEDITSRRLKLRRLLNMIFNSAK
jgi:hypothetical protein